MEMVSATQQNYLILISALKTIKYAKKAKDQGWDNDWDDRIAKCQKKIGKLKNDRRSVITIK